MRKALLSGVLAVLLGPALSGQDHPDFSGRWILESPLPPPSDIPRALSVRQALVSRTVRGEPMKPFFKDIVIEREFENVTRSETHQIGVVGGVVSGLGLDGKTSGQRQHHAVRWDANALVFESGSYTGQTPETGVWTERREVWSRDDNGRLHLMITTRSSVDASRAVALVYRRVSQPQGRVSH
jgi:hypothetical protein